MRTIKKHLLERRAAIENDGLLSDAKKEFRLEVLSGNQERIAFVRELLDKIHEKVEA